MVKRYLALYLVMVLTMLGMSLVEWSHNDPITGNVIQDQVSLDVVEITEADFVSLGASSKQVSVKGVMLGDSLDSVTETLGAPDFFKPYDSPDGQTTIVNLEYKFGAPKIAMVVNVKNGIVDRITVLSPFNQFLVGESKLGYDKLQVYKNFDVPDNQEALVKYWVYSYYDMGLDVMLENKVAIGYSFFTSPLY